MNELKLIIAKNIAELRFRDSMTQSELAEKLNYSDKAVSKWERGESLPDISVLVEIADIFGVTIDYLIREDASKVSPENFNEPVKKIKKNRVLITVISILAVWLLAAWAFSLADILPISTHMHWLAFVYAVPISTVIWLVFNTIWFNRRITSLIISVLMWSLLASVYLTLFMIKINFWQIFIVGVPGEAIILAWTNISKIKKPHQRKIRIKKSKKEE